MAHKTVVLADDRGIYLRTFPTKEALFKWCEERGLSAHEIAHGLYELLE